MEQQDKIGKLSYSKHEDLMLLIGLIITVIAAAHVAGASLIKASVIVIGGTLIIVAVNLALNALAKAKRRRQLNEVQS